MDTITYHNGHANGAQEIVRRFHLKHRPGRPSFEQFLSQGPEKFSIHRAFALVTLSEVAHDLSSSHVLIDLVRDPFSLSHTIQFLTNVIQQALVFVSSVDYPLVACIEMMYATIQFIQFTMSKTQEVVGLYIAFIQRLGFFTIWNDLCPLF